MPITSATPYLFFNGNAEQAIERYRKALGAKVENLSRYGEVNGSCADADKRRVMHALLVLGDARVMLSDSPSDRPSALGEHVQVCLDFADVNELSRAFDALAADGKVIMAPHDTFWGAKFGALVDAFGIHWLFNCTHKPQ